MVANKVTAVKRLTLLTIVGAVTLFGATANAMCAYNSTNVEIKVEFDCGWFCGNQWDMQPNSHDCRPNKSGHFLADFFSAGEGQTARVNLEVDAHGWVEMTLSSDGKVQVCAYKQDSSLSACQTFDP